MFHSYLVLFAALVANSTPEAAQTLGLKTLAGLTFNGTAGQAAKFKGRECVRLAVGTPGPINMEEAFASIDGTDFADGTIDVDLAGRRAPDALAGGRGFVGIAFRMQDQGKRFECIYLRVTNARADDQLRRNHSVQYVSAPDFGYDVLREKSPGVYESYADMEPDAWTHLRIEVANQGAKFYVGRASQPCLIVNDLKLGASAHGPVALWIGPGTEAYFSNLRIQRK